MRFSNILSLCFLVWLATTYVEAGRVCYPSSFGNGGGGNGGGPINPGGPIKTLPPTETTQSTQTPPQTTARTQPICPKRPCAYCSSGFRYNITTGCDTCDCVDPCERTQCDPGQTCQALQPPCPHYCTTYGCADKYCYKIAQCNPVTTAETTSPTQNPPVEATTFESLPSTPRPDGLGFNGPE